MTAKLCEEKYRRPTGQVLTCHYLLNHPADNHSWWTVAMEDRHGSRGGLLDADAVVAGILEGWFDPYLEAILAAAHGRKRELRCVRLPYGSPTSRTEVETR